MAQQTPLYQQIAADMRRRIGSGEFAAETALPTEGELQAKYAASRNTVREAIKLLTQQNLLEVRAGRGTFIKKVIVPFVTTLSTDPTTGFGAGGEGATYPARVREQGREAGAGQPEVAIVSCPPHIAARLDILASEEVVSRYQRRFIDGTIWSIQTSYYPMKWVRQGAVGLLSPKDMPEGAVQYITETIGLNQISYRDLILARLPEDGERSLFGLMHSHTVVEIYRTSFAEDGTPIRVTVTVLPSDRNQIIYDIGRVPERREEPVQL